jgi:hypothetical protein
MEYPNEFPQDSRARLDAAQVKAERDFVKAEQTLESSPFPTQYQSAVENLSKHYINSVFFSFANEAIRIAKEGIWPACRIQPELEKFGASLIFSVERSKFCYRNGWAFPKVNALFFRAEVWTGIKSSERWLAFLDDLTTVAEAQADAASSNFQVGASDTFRTAQSVKSSTDDSKLFSVRAPRSGRTSRSALLAKRGFKSLWQARPTVRPTTTKSLGCLIAERKLRTRHGSPSATSQRLEEP